MKYHASKIITIYFLLSFVLHLVWENAQASLYGGFESFTQHFSACFYATITGDMIFMAIIYLSLSIIHKDISWIQHKKKFLHPATWFITILIGILLAINFELWAVYVDYRWIYETMPVVPILKIGWTPLLQMIFIPLTILGIHYKLAK